MVEREPIDDGRIIDAGIIVPSPTGVEEPGITYVMFGAPFIVDEDRRLVVPVKTDELVAAGVDFTQRDPFCDAVAVEAEVTVLPETIGDVRPTSFRPLPPRTLETIDAWRIVG